MLQLATSIFSLIGAFTAAVISVLLSFQGFKNKIRYSYFLAVSVGSLWLLFYSIWLWQTNEDIAIFLLRIVMTFAIFTYPTFLHFVFIFADYRNKILIYAAYISASILAYFCLFTDLFMRGVSEKMTYLFWPNRGGVIFDIYVLMWILVILISLTLLFRSYRVARDPFRRSQIRIILIGAILGYIGGATNFFLWYNIPIPPFGNLVIPLYFSLIAYAILKYRFADIRMVIRRSAVFTVLVTMITAIYALIAYLITLFFQGVIGAQSAILNGIITAIFVALGFEPLKKWLSEATDNFLFKAEYKPQEVLGEFADQLSTTLDLKTIANYITTKNHQIFKSTKVSLFLHDKATEAYEEISMAGKAGENIVQKIDKELFTKIFTYLKKQREEKDIIVRDEIKKINEQRQNKVINLLIDQLEKNEVNLVVPMFVKDELVGILFLGDKKSGDIYSNEDIGILTIIAGQAAIAIKNSQLFEEEKLFAIHLKQEVERATKELRAANAQLKQLDQAKSEFISIASHQLRTPLTAIKGFMSMVQQGDYGKVPMHMDQPIDRVLQSTNRIINLVEDLLNISRIESGRLEYDIKPADLNVMVEDVMSELIIQAQKKNLKLTYHKPAKKIPKINLDESKVREVVMNLIDNAVKYTAKGKVDVYLEKTDDHVLFKVVDTGRGIANKDMSLLFQKFSRVQGVQLVHTEGTGLGLYIAKNIIAKHNGRIWAESDGEGKGSRFMIEFKI